MVRDSANTKAGFYTIVFERLLSLLLCRFGALLQLSSHSNSTTCSINTSLSSYPSAGFTSGDDISGWCVGLVMLFLSFQMTLHNRLLPGVEQVIYIGWIHERVPSSEAQNISSNGYLWLPVFIGLKGDAVLFFKEPPVS